MEHLKNFLSGASQVLNLAGTGIFYALPQKGGFAQDYRALKVDNQKISAELYKQIKEHGKQIYHR